jgi:glycogen debranching enzyme
LYECVTEPRETHITSDDIIRIIYDTRLDLRNRDNPLGRARVIARLRAGQSLKCASHYFQYMLSREDVASLHPILPIGRTVMNRALRYILLFILSASTNAPSLSSQNDYATPIMVGISNHGRTNSRPYVTAGDRAYLIGTQDGKFPDLGEHLPGEMGGLWLHPIKLIDGFAAELTDEATNQHAALSESTEFINYPYGNLFKYDAVLDGVEIERFQFSPDRQPGLIVRYTIKNATDRTRALSFQFSVKTDLRPVWYSEHLGIKDARDTVAWSSTNHVFVARDTDNPWFCVWGATPSRDAHPVAHPAPMVTSGAGVTAASSYSLTVGPHDTTTLTFVIAGSTTSRGAAVSAYSYLSGHRATLLTKKVAHYASIVDRARVRIPDQHLQEVYNWVKVNTAWLTRDVPGLGRGLGAGLMEYPWWFSDMYTLQALTATGDFELAKQSLRLLQTQSMKANHNGRIVHELTTNGAVINPGNTQETAQFITTVGTVVDWTGDVGFAREMYPAMTSGIDWLLTDMDRNKDLFPEGYGIMEVYGLNAELIDVSVYTQQALRATAHIATILGQPEAAKHYRQLASQLEQRINQKLWLEDERSYADFYGSRSQAISAAAGAIKQIELQGTSNLTRRDSSLIRHYEQVKQQFSALPDTSRGWLTNENWVITTPMEVGIAPRARAIEALDKIRKDNVGEYGPYLSAVERGAMMTIATGVQAVSEGNYGRSDESLWYVDKIAQTFDRTLPGSISEMMPDYGCFAIGWTSYGIVIPLVQQMFGIRPDAVHKTVVFDPHLPTGWENVSIADVRVGTNAISFSRTKTEKGIEYHVEAKEGGWNFVLRGAAVPGAKYYLNGRPVSFTASGIRMTGRKNHLRVVEARGRRNDQ